MSSKGTNKRDYGSVAWFYEHLSCLYSAGRIRQAKVSQVNELRPGDKVLYVGMGAGEDAVIAAQHGSDITCIDLSPEMIARTRRKFDSAHLAAEFICCDVMTYNRTGSYDVVIANFFLNIFDELAMKEVLAHLVSLLKPGGKLMIADFAPVKEGLSPLRIIHYVYYWLAIGFYWILRLEPLHPVYDYTSYFAELGLARLQVRFFGLDKLGLVPYCSITAVRINS
ncbi:MAG: class I SAM-dependent methyltransferase [Chloroflexota bacterium]|nr:class I SAM-dependent methyltransferase [Chloroflexota bacterium]